MGGGGGGGRGGNQDSTSKIFPQSGCHRKKISRMLESGILYRWFFFKFNSFSLLLKDARSEGPSTSFARGPLRVTLVGDEWGSSKCGLSTLNRELAKHLASQPGVEVTVLLLHYSEKEGKKLMKLMCVLLHHRRCLCQILS